MSDQSRYVRFSALRDLGFGRDTLRRWLDSGLVCGCRVGGQRFYDRESVIEFAARGGEVRRVAEGDPLLRFHPRNFVEIERRNNV